MGRKTKHLTHGEIKAGVSIGLTKTAVEGLDKLADQMGMSRSELVEQIGRGLIPVNSPLAGESLTN
ncbi:ribbon-helix-helix protein, CopG family [Planktothrix sp.]|uniref:ribbon-helix-helix protein, CopG family n=1 Tax=Planktothrix sp. TaxID=3088171 RepID=UPI0038D4EFCD